MLWYSMAELSLNHRAPVIILDVEITGRFTETAKLALDTGSTHLLLPWRIAKALGLQLESSSQRIETITASGSEFAPLVFLPSVKVLGKEARNVSAIVRDLPPKSYVDGLLGLSFLKNFKLTLDFKEGILRLE